MDDVPDPVEMHRKRRRSHLRLAGAGMCAAVASFAGALLIAGPSGSSARSDLAAAEAHDEDIGPVPWEESLLEECRTAPLEQLGPSGESAVRLTDTATREVVEVDARELCAAEIALQPDPTGDIGVGFRYEDGRLVADYFELHREVVDGVEHVGNGAPIPPAEAARRIAEQDTKLHR